MVSHWSTRRRQYSGNNVNILIRVSLIHGDTRYKTPNAPTADHQLCTPQISTANGLQRGGLFATDADVLCTLAAGRGISRYEEIGLLDECSE